MTACARTFCMYLANSAACLVCAHAVADLLARLLPRQLLRRTERVHLEDLVAGLRADDLGDVARLERLEDLPQLGHEVRQADRADQAAVGLRRRLRDLGHRFLEALSRLEPGLQRVGLRLGRFVQPHAERPQLVRRHRDQDLAQHHRRRRRELGLVRLEVRLGLGLGHRDPPDHLLALHLLDDHRLLEALAQVGHRQVLALERRLELLLGLDLVLLLDVVEDALELLVGQLVAEFLAALQQQELVDGVHDQLRRDVRPAPSSSSASVIALRVDPLPLPDHGALPRLEVGLGDDVAVHLHQDALDDLRRRRPDPAASRPACAASDGASPPVTRTDDETAGRRADVSLNLSNPSILLRNERAQHAAHPRQHAGRPARVFLLGPQDGVLAEAGRAPRPAVARAVHQDARRRAQPAGHDRPRPGTRRREAAASAPLAAARPFGLRPPGAFAAVHARSSFRLDGGASVTSGRSPTSRRTRCGSGPPCPLNVKTTREPWRSIDSTPSRSAATRMRP